MDCSPPGSSPGKNTGVGCCALLQGVFLTQGSNVCFLCLVHLQADSLPLSPLGSRKYLSSELLWVECLCPLKLIC